MAMYSFVAGQERAGTKPAAIPPTDGLQRKISTRKQAPMVATSIRMKASILRMPNAGSPAATARRRR